MNLEAALYKTLTFLGLALLLGGTFFRRGVGRGLNVPLGALGIGALLILLGGLLEPVATLRGLLGSFAPGDYLDYVLNSTSGQAALLRLALAAALLALEVQGLRSWVPSALLGVGLLATVSATGHGRALGNVTYGLDVAHLAAMVAWLGAVAFLAWQPRGVWRREAGAIQATVERVSKVGLWSVAALTASGTVAVLYHLPPVALRQTLELGALTGTPYGLLLLSKLAVFLAVLLLAARNRFALMKPGRESLLRGTMRLESALLTLVLAISGTLASSAPPDVPKTPATTPISLSFGAASVAGEFRTNETGGVTAQLAVRGSAAAPGVTLVMTDHPMPPVHLEFQKSGTAYAATGQLWMTGTWFADVRLGGQTQRVPLLTR